ncbi:FliM/FliN family flagellar motor switch protein [Thioclava sp. FR2]|uniref:FliM/FliN family flagellar motor switch protein n=1 Tax=Thioclava sp. FR2 TaxID=3445780 RepID=UPI003EBCE995
MSQKQILRKKIKIVRKDREAGSSSVERAWRIGFSRALRDEAKVAAEFSTMSISRMSLAELLELPPDRALILTLEGPDAGMGMVMLSSELFSAITEILTLGLCRSLPAEPRKPTRTDAAMVAPVIEQALRNLEHALEEDPDLLWTSGFHFASCLEDARPLGLLFEDIPYKVFRGRLTVADGKREGEIILVLPADGKGRTHDILSASVVQMAERPTFRERLAKEVGQAEVKMDAVVSRLTLPISEALALRTDMVLTLPSTSLDQISIEGFDGRKLAIGKLGQQRGMRAIRLTTQATSSGSPVSQTKIASDAISSSYQSFDATEVTNLLAQTGT